MTGFFHVPSAFGVLEEKVIPALFQGKTSTDQIRVWVAGCATGEEAFSVAILLTEYASTLSTPPTIEIFATDNDEEALEVARAGLYPVSIGGEMSKVCLDKYFMPGEDGYTIIPEVKASVHFSSHDVLIDNSFQSFELITCRHLLAYLDRASQAQIVSFFHHSLRDQGFLFLGDAEFAESLPHQFVSVDSVFKIYRLTGPGQYKSAEESSDTPVQHIDAAPSRVGNMLYPEQDITDADEVLPRYGDVAPEKVSMPASFDEKIEEEAVMESGVSEIEEVAPDERPEEEPFAISIEDVYPRNDDIYHDFASAVKELIQEEKADEVESVPDTSLDMTLQELEASPGVIAEDDPILTPVGVFWGEEVAQDQSSVTVNDSPAGKGQQDPAQNIPPAAAGPASEGDGILEPPGHVVEPTGKPAVTPHSDSEIQAIAQHHLDLLLNQYTPASILIDRSFNILDVSGRIGQIFILNTRDFTTDYLDKLPDVRRLQIEEMLNQIFHEKNAGEVVHFKIPSITESREVILEARYADIPVEGAEVIHLLLRLEKPSRNGQKEPDENVSFFATPLGDRKGTNGQLIVSSPTPTLPESLLDIIRVAPYPMLVHVEGGKIIAISQPWFDLAGLHIEDAPTISAWTKKARGQRLRLKDSKLKESYEKAGVVCISIRAPNGDAKLLAFHSYFMGTDAKGRKMTLTMAVDITNYPGHTGMGIMPESADFGVAAKKAFLANISHEIRTPLTSMIGFADYLIDKLNGQDVQFAQYISESGNRLLETLNAVLRVASMDGLESSLRYEDVDITVEAQGILQLFKPHAEQFGIPLKLVVEQPAKANLDRAAFRRILTNLLGNAIKFTQDGEVTITINSDPESVIVDVEDTGVGISEDFLPFIFDRFAQEAKGQARSHSGCGLGLTISRNLAEAMGGTIEVETQAGVGSQFTVRLPKKPEVQEEGPELLDQADTEEIVEKAKILVVEDNIDTQELMLLILREKYDIHITSNATETLQHTQKEVYDVILMDLNLGGRQTGFELLRELRKRKPYQSTPVLAVSALPIGVIRKQLIREGFNGYIAKPFTRARILDALGGVLGS